MSLLLEALKKAEKAKEEAQRRAQGSSPAAAATNAFDPEATAIDEGHPVTTRDQLPDISSQMEILSDDIQAPADAPPVELRLADEPPSPREAKAPPRPAARPGAGTRDASNADRATAQRVFEAKFKEPNPRLPFYITMAVLSAFAVGTVVYFWIQLRPPPSLVNPNPTKSADERPVDTSTAKPPAAPAGGAPAADAGTIPGLPSGAASPAATAVQAPPPAVPAPAANVAAVPPSAAAAAIAKPTAGASVRTQRTKPSAAADGEDRAVSVRRASPQIHPQVSAGYAAFQAGDLQKAREAYEQVLREEPANRDALLGLAAVEMRAQRYDLSDAYYQRVLRADPRDPHAQAGVMALRAQQLDPVAVESRVKSLLAADREANVLYFTLGNQFAQQGRWADAQQAYFKAFAADPGNPDFAFNLAVSLDHLRQPALALEYYRKALQLAENRSAGFSADAARLRVQQLAPQGSR